MSNPDSAVDNAITSSASGTSTEQSNMADQPIPLQEQECKIQENENKEMHNEDTNLKVDSDANSETSRSTNKDDVFKMPSLSFAPVKLVSKAATAKDEGSPKEEAKDSATDSTEKNDQKEKILQKPKAKPAAPQRKPKCVPQVGLSDYYSEPMWGGVSDGDFSIEILKNGSIVDVVSLTKKSFYVFGRMQDCDIVAEHPSLSRYHAVMQNCPMDTQRLKKGWYVYDLGSTHGTYVNKNRIAPQTYYKVNVGHMLKFGGSSRLYIIQGPEEDAEPESDLTVTELKEKREREKKEMEDRKQKEEEEKRKEEELAAAKEAEGCSWGFGEDAVTEKVSDDEEEINLEDIGDELTLNDPKKSLKGFFEREGLDMPEYEFEELEKGKRLCHIELPIDKPNGECVRAEVMGTGKKKELVIQCALEACKILHKYGMFKKANQESRRKRSRDWEAEDFYDSDDDSFLDRTGEIERKRMARMKKAGKVKEKAQSYDSLKSELDAVEQEMSEIESELHRNKAGTTAGSGAGEGGGVTSEVDALDAYMKSIRGGAMDAGTRMTKKMRLLELKTEQSRLQKLCMIAKPAALPKSLQSVPLTTKTLPMFGRIHKAIPKKSTVKGPTLPPPTTTPNRQGTEETAVEEEESEEEDGEQPMDTSSTPADTKTSADQESPTATDDKKSTKTVECKDTPMDTETDSVSDIQTSANGHTCDTVQHTYTQQVKTDSISKVDDKSTGSNSTSACVVSAASSKSVVSNSEDVCVKSGEDTDVKKLPAVQKPAKKPTKPHSKGMSAYMERVAQELNKDDQESGAYDSKDPNFAVWVPPQGQTGDGKTHLNEKYGY